MSRDEFLRVLKESLSASLENDAITEQLDYYDKYISDEIDKGRSEKEVLDELGDPRLIAKTIKTVNNASGIVDQTESHSKSYSTDGSRVNRDSNSNNKTYKRYVDTTGVGCALVGIIVFIVFMLVMRMFGYMAYGLGSLAFSGPLGFIIVAALFYLFFGGKRR